MKRYCRHLVFFCTLTLSSACSTLLPSTSDILAPRSLEPLAQSPLTPDPASTSPATVTPTTPNSHILALPAELTALLDEKVRPITHPYRRANRLLELLFSTEELGLHYQYDRTLSAGTAFAEGRGNCISLANLVVAAARHVGLDARFQYVETGRSWNRVGSVYFLDNHINVRILGISRARDYEVDLLPNPRRRSRASTLLSDREAFAHYYNNLAGEALTRDQDQLAYDFFVRALEEAPRQAFIWANLGTLYLRHNQFRAAEIVLHQALSLDGRHYVAINNLSQLYHLTGRPEEAARFDRRAESIRMENPYHLAQLAEEHLEEGQLNAARKRITEALRKNDSDYILHLLASRIYLALEEREPAAHHLREVSSRTDTDDISVEHARLIATLEAEL